MRSAINDIKILTKQKIALGQILYHKNDFNENKLFDKKIDITENHKFEKNNKTISQKNSITLCILWAETPIK